MISIFQIKRKEMTGLSSDVQAEIHDMACRSKSNDVVPSKSYAEKIGNHMGKGQLFWPQMRI